MLRWGLCAAGGSGAAGVGDWGGRLGSVWRLRWGWGAGVIGRGCYVDICGSQTGGQGGGAAVKGVTRLTGVAGVSAQGGVKLKGFAGTNA